MATEGNQQNSSMKLQVGEKPPLANHDSSVLDLAFAMDVTGSMGSYIHAAQQSIRQIVEEIVAGEKSDIRLALVEYRDHPPQDDTFVTRTHDFTDSVKTMKGWLDASSADGGGDTPEAVADAMHDVLKLSWRPEATKICVLISDAPPHGLMGGHDGFPEGCPAGLDPVVIINQMAEKNITVYSVGCEPSVNECRDFFMALAHITGGQYVPLRNAQLLAKVIIGGAQEEITLQRLMEEVHEEVMQEMQTCGGADEIDEDLLAMNVHKKLAAKGAKTKTLLRNEEELEAASDFAQVMSTKGTTMAAWKKEWDAAGKSSKSEPMSMMCMSAPRPMMMRKKMKIPKKKTADGDAENDESSECEEDEGFDMMECHAMPEMCCDEIPVAYCAMPAMAECPPMMGGGFASTEESADPSESYSVVDTDLKLEQAKRMVKKSIAMNRANFKK